MPKAVIDGGYEDAAPAPSFTNVDKATTAAASERFAREIKTKVSQLSATDRGVVEQNAAAYGMTPQQYLDARGGLTAAGYYGDTPAYRTLTKAEYDKFFAPGGGGTQALNREMASRELQNLIDGGMSRDQAIAKMLKQGTNASDLGLSNEQAKALTGGQYVPFETGAAAGTPASGAATTAGGALTAAQQSANENAIELLKRTFSNYGLESLAGKITEFVQKGYKSDTISLMLQDTPEYKQRFAANEARKKAGLAVLSPAEYLATEAAYRQVMSAAGLPKGFYDSASDFQKFLENDMSPSELNQRVSAAEKSVQNADPLYAQQLQKLYGLGTGDMIAYALDPEKALPLVERRAKAIDYATAAAQQGINVGAQPSEYFADLGVTAARARQGFANIAQTMPTYEKLQNIYGAQGQDVLTNLQAAAFGGAGQAAAEQDILRKRRQEQATFGGSSGVGQTSLGGGVAAGQL